MDTLLFESDNNICVGSILVPLVDWMVIDLIFDLNYINWRFILANNNWINITFNLDLNQFFSKIIYKSCFLIFFLLIFLVSHHVIEISNKEFMLFWVSFKSNHHLFSRADRQCWSLYDLVLFDWITVIAMESINVITKNIL